MRAAYGLMVEGGELVPNPAETATVAMVKYLRDRGQSYRQIGWELYRAGHRPRSGGEWHPDQVRRIALQPH